MFLMNCHNLFILTFFNLFSFIQPPRFLNLVLIFNLPELCTIKYSSFPSTQRNVLLQFFIFCICLYESLASHARSHAINSLFSRFSRSVPGVETRNDEPALTQLHEEFCQLPICSTYPDLETQQRVWNSTGWSHVIIKLIYRHKSNLHSN